ncbi:MAG: hypothetical protein ACWGNS_11050 [Burkholderiales bacterium]
MSAPTFEKGALTVYFGEKSGKYPDGNQIVVRGRDTRVAFDTPLVANRLPMESVPVFGWRSDERTGVELQTKAEAAQEGEQELEVPETAEDEESSANDDEAE